MSEIAPPHDFIYTAEKIRNCAGVVPGDDVFTHERDMCARRRAAQLIQQIGIGLKCAQVVMNSAIIMMHRLFVYWPSHKLPLGKVAAACFFLAAKMEDCPRRLIYVVQQYLRHERQVTDIKQVSDEEISHVGEEIVLLESLILPCLGFSLTITQPHNMLNRGVRALDLPRSLAQAAYYNCTNLLHLTMMVLRLRPETLAAACIQMAASWSNTELPSASETDGKFWFNYFDPKMTPELLKEAVDECIAELTKVPAEAKQTLKVLTKATPTSTQLMQLQQQQMLKRQQEREAAAKAAKAAAAAASKDSVAAMRLPSGTSNPAVSVSAPGSHQQHQQQQPQQPHARPLSIDEYKKRRQIDASAAAGAPSVKPPGPPAYHHQQQQRHQQQLPWSQHHRQQPHQHHQLHHHSGQHPHHHQQQQQQHHHHHHHRSVSSGATLSMSSAPSGPSGPALAPPPPSLPQSSMSAGAKRPHHHLGGGGGGPSSNDSNQSKKHKPAPPHYFTK